jgi:hypothetical protein
MLSKRGRAKMKKVILCAIVLAVHGVLLNSVLAQDQVDRYLVTYVQSIGGDTKGIRSLTAVTVVNQSSLSCPVQVTFFRPDGITRPCTLIATLAPGVTHNYCSRNVSSLITPCDSTCTSNLTLIDLASGKAIVSSTDVFECSLIAVDARVYYTMGGAAANDTAITAISNSKIVFAGEGNLGD